MGCDRTEFRLLLHAHDSLGAWEKWLLQRHLDGCPGCREQWERFLQERRLLSTCLAATPLLRVADRVALELGVPRPSSGPRMVVPRRLPMLILILISLLAAGAAAAYVQWRGPGAETVGHGMSTRPADAICDEKMPDAKVTLPPADGPACTAPPAAPGSPVAVPGPVLAPPIPSTPASR